jgi:hypothetical protein
MPPTDPCVCARSSLCFQHVPFAHSSQFRQSGVGLFSYNRHLAEVHVHTIFSSMQRFLVGSSAFYLLCWLFV